MMNQPEYIETFIPPSRWQSFLNIFRKAFGWPVCAGTYRLSVSYKKVDLLGSGQVEEK